MLGMFMNSFFAARLSVCCMSVILMSARTVYHSVSQSSKSLPLTTNPEEAEVERFFKDLQDLLELTPKKDVLFIIGNWNAKVGSQELPGVKARLVLKCKMKQGKD